MASNVYKKAGILGGARHGDTYQIHVLMLMCERAASRECFSDFRLATEQESAGKFDDAVLSWKDPDGAPKWMFVQVKHKQKGTINDSSLFPKKEEDMAKGDFSLFKYLLSMWEIHHSNEFEGEKQFVLYSNLAANDSIKKWFEEAKLDGGDVLEVSAPEARYLKLCVDQQLIESLLRYTNKDFDELASTLRAIFIDGGAECQYDILNRYRGALVNKVLLTKKKVVRFTPRFITNKKLDYNEFILRNRLFGSDSTLEKLQSYSTAIENVVDILTSKHDSNNKLPAFIDVQEANELLDRLTFAIGQPDNEILKKIIRDDLQQFSSAQDPAAKDCYTQLLYITLQRMMHDWLDLKDAASFMTKIELKTQFDALHRTIDRSKIDLTTEKFKGEMQNLRVNISGISISFPGFPLIWVTSTERGVLSSLKIAHIIDKKHYRYSSLRDLKIASVRTQMCETLRNTVSEIILLLRDDVVLFEFFDELWKVISRNQNIKLILITNNWKRAQSYFIECSHFIYKDTDTSFDDLHEHTQQILSTRIIVFQNFEISLGRLFEHGIPKSLIKNEMLEKLILDEVVEFGPKLPEMGTKIYMSRIISSCESDEPTNGRNSSSDLDVDDLNDLLEDDLESAVQYDEEKFVHNFSKIFSECKLILLSAEPGMGKTTLWTRLAKLTKQYNKSSLVIHIKCLDCVSELRKTEEINSVTEFLCKVTRMETPFEKLLLSEFLDNCDSYVFLDGFDELPYDTITTALSLLRTLQNHTSLFVSTRTNQKVVLEQARSLSTKTFTLEPLNKREQSFLLYIVCEVTSNGTVKDNFNKTLDKLHSNLTLIGDKIIGVPLMITMLAEILKPYFDSLNKADHFNSTSETALDSLNLLELYELFTYNSFRRQQIEKLNLDIRNPLTERMLDKKSYAFKGFMNLHCYLGLLLLVKQQKMKLIIPDEKELAELHDQTLLLDSPIILKFVNKLPYFNHASFSEFFAAKCLFEHFNSLSSKQLHKRFVKDENVRNVKKKQYIVDLFSLYHKVLRDNATVRKFFFLMVKSNESCWVKLDILLRCMRPYPLLWACEENFEELVQRLLEEDASIVEHQIKHIGTALHISAARGNSQICGLLINHGARVDMANRYGQRALHLAATGGFFEVISLLITRGATLDARDKKLQTALHLAAQAGDTNAVRVLTKNGCNVNILNERKWNALHLAAFNSHVEVVRILIENGSELRCGAATNWLMFLGHLVPKSAEITSMIIRHDIKLRTDDSSTDDTLSWAFRKNHIHIVEAIHASGVNVHKIDPQARVCTYRLALRKHQFELAKFILTVQNGACEVLDYPLHAAAEAGSLECVLIMLKKQAEVNAKDNNGMTPLELALKKSHPNIVQLLLQKSAAIDKCSLHTAISSNMCYASAQCISLLLAHGADINATDSNRRTALHIAALRNNWWCVKTLLSHGGSLISAEDEAGKTPLHLAAYNNSDAVIRSILEYAMNQNADFAKQLVNKQDNKGRTALHESCSRDNYESLRHLLGVPVDVNCCTDKNQTPLHIAAMGGHWNVSLLLLKREAATAMKDIAGKTFLDLAIDNGHEGYVRKCRLFLQIMGKKYTM